jgi:hypothetical protein
MRKFIVLSSLLAVAIATPAFAQSRGATPGAKLTTTTVQNNPLALIRSFTVEDLQAALADAQAPRRPIVTPRC